MRNQNTMAAMNLETLEDRQLMSGSFDFAPSIAPTQGGTVNAGANMAITVTLTNVGSATATNFHVGPTVYLSADANISNDDIVLSTPAGLPNTNIGSVRVGQSKSVRCQQPIPATLPTGDYYLIYRYQDIADWGPRQQFDSNSGNNIAFCQIHVNAVPVNTRMTLNQPYGNRGQTVPVIATLTDSKGAPLANKTVRFLHHWDRSRTDKQFATGTTNSAGQIVLNYAISKDVNVDNTYITAVFDGDTTATKSSAQIRVQVGRFNPQGK